VTNVLVVTSTVRVLNGVHGNTTHIGPAVAFDFVLVEGAAGLQHGLVATAAASADADHGAAGGLNDLFGAGRQTHARLSGVQVVRDDGRVVAGGAGHLASVSGLLLHVADDGAFGHGTQSKHVADLQLGLLATVDKLAGVHALGGDKSLLHLLELVGVTEGNAGQRCATSGVMEDLLDHALDVTVLLAIIEGSELGSSLAGSGVRLKDAAGTFTAR